MKYGQFAENAMELVEILGKARSLPAWQLLSTLATQNAEDTERDNWTAITVEVEEKDGTVDVDIPSMHIGFVFDKADGHLKGICNWKE